MTDSEKLDLLLSKFAILENRFDNLENKVNTITKSSIIGKR